MEPRKAPHYLGTQWLVREPSAHFVCYRPRMPDLDLDMEQLLSDLEALPWSRHLEARSVQIISERFGVHIDDAEAIIERLQAQGTIEAESESIDPSAPDEAPSCGRKWKVVR